MSIVATRNRTRFLTLPILALVFAPGCGEPGSSDSPATGGVVIGAGGTASGGVAAVGGASGVGGGLPATGGVSSGGTAAGGASSGGISGVGGAGTGGFGPSSGGGVGVGGAGAGGASVGGAQGSGGGSNGEGTLHVFMLMGQSNMAGVADKQASDSNTDERMKVFGGCKYTAGQWNTVVQPPLNECPGEKGWNLDTAVDPGIWFAKTMLPKLPAGDTIGLVGTAESGEKIETFITGGSHHQMILNKIAGAKATPNARFAGIIFHQGESNNTEASWPGKVVQLYNEVKAAWGVQEDVPMVLGELPAGGCCSAHNTRVHEAADQLPQGYWISQQGTNVMDEYHFDHASVVLMGTRYGETMIEALGW
jgi:Carbohydrate esterase, sialic acid-specific acetylesterase